MRYSFRLAELLGHDPDPNKRPGTIKMIVEHTGLDRHQVANLLRNEVKYLPVHALSRICDYLIEKGHCRASELPGKLFAVEPEHFWELLARRARLELCLGVRVPNSKDGLDGALVVASDSVLVGEVLNGVSTMGEASGSLDQSGASLSEDPVQPSVLRQSLVWSPKQTDEDKMLSRAYSVYNDFGTAPGDKALLGIGSVKSNPIVELMISNAFRCKPFLSETVARAVDRSCPFFLRFRNEDPTQQSSSGGLVLAADTPSDKPGIYYETADNKWTLAPCDKSKDAALVYYVHRESQGRLEMALGGFSGRATRTLARTLASRAEEFWPPVYEGHGVQVGAFIVEYTYDKKGELRDDFLRTDWVAKTTKVTRLDPSVIERRIV
ncbi:MAG: helix-turn-helix transcriptional regulator [Planctomycetales bacterium]|nr:helix-turn-helix transcriptional regulator [Planctomycetales bacterium]